MTEQEWLECTDPEPMLDFLGCDASDRKLRLFAIAWAHQCYPHIGDERSRVALDVAERYVEGERSHAELTIVFREAQQVCNEIWHSGRGKSGRGVQQARHAADSARDAANPAWGTHEAKRAAQIGGWTKMGVER